MTDHLRAALYARVSTTDKGQDPELQLRDLRTYVAAHGWEIAHEYVDVGISGCGRSGQRSMRSWRTAGSARWM